jgi:hypothetical protein
MKKIIEDLNGIIVLEGIVVNLVVDFNMVFAMITHCG